MNAFYDNRNILPFDKVLHIKYSAKGYFDVYYGRDVTDYITFAEGDQLSCFRYWLGERTVPKNGDTDCSIR